MKPVIMYPDPSLKSKLYLIVSLVAVLALISVFLITWLIAADDHADEPLTIATIVTLLANALWVVPAWVFIPLFYRSLQYEIHEDEVIVRIGVITKSVKHVPYRTVTNITVLQGLFDRLFGIGTVNIQTAGMSGQQGAEESLIGLPNFQEVYERIAETLRRFRGGMSPTQAEMDVEAGTGGKETLGAILGEVQAIRRALEDRTDLR